MKKFLLNNIGWKLLSVGIAILLWLIVLNISDPVDTQTFYNVAVEMINTDILTDSGRVYEVLDNTGSISVRVSAKRSILNNLTKDNILAVADFADMTLSNTVAIKLSSTKNNNDIESITSPTEYLKLNVEEMSRKQLVIDVVTVGTPAENYSVGKVETDQNIVRISGPSSVVNQVEVAQAVVDVTGMHEDISTSAELRFYNSEGMLIQASNLTSNISYVNVSVSILTTKTVGLSYNVIGTPAQGYGLTGHNTNQPDVVTVIGPESTLNNLSFIPIPDGELDVSGLSATLVKDIDIRKYLPSNVKLIDGSIDIITITIPIEKIEVTNVIIPEENVLLNNIPEGYEATLVGYSDHNRLKISGLQSVVGSFDSRNLFGTIDVTKAFEDAGSEPAEGVYAMKVDYTNMPDEITQVEDHLVVVQLTKITGDNQSNNENAGQGDNADAGTEPQ